MAYTLTPADLASLPWDAYLGTDRFLPSWDEIPAHFHQESGYTTLAVAILEGTPYPGRYIRLREPFRICAWREVRQVMYGHLVFPDVSEKHRIAGVAFMLSFVVELFTGPRRVLLWGHILRHWPYAWLRFHVRKSFAAVAKRLSRRTH